MEANSKLTKFVVNSKEGLEDLAKLSESPAPCWLHLKYDRNVQGDTSWKEQLEPHTDGSLN